MTPHDSIVIRLPYPVKFLTIPRKIGFLFTNMASFLFREASGLKTGKDLKEWTEKNGYPALINEMAYYAARAYCLETKTKENFTKEGLMKALALAPEEKKMQILKVWESSQTFGATIKKKIVSQAKK